MTTIVHTTDLLDHDRPAFEHGIALALTSGASLVSLHASRSGEGPEKMPDAEEVMRRWGREPSAIHYDARVHSCFDDVVDTVLDGLRQIGPSLVVATPHERGVLGKLLGGSRAEAIAHNVSAPVLLFPANTRGFIDPDDGSSTLAQVIVPFGDPEAGQVALKRVEWIAEMAGIEQIDVVVLVVGDNAKAPSLDHIPVSRARLRVELAPGSNVATAVAERSAENSLVVMATRAHDSVLDVLRGTHTDRVLHQVGCPILSVRI